MKNFSEKRKIFVSALLLSFAVCSICLCEHERESFPEFEETTESGMVGKLNKTNETFPAKIIFFCWKRKMMGVTSFFVNKDKTGNNIEFLIWLFCGEWVECGGMAVIKLCIHWDGCRDYTEKCVMVTYNLWEWLFNIFYI